MPLSAWTLPFLVVASCLTVQPSVAAAEPNDVAHVWPTLSSSGVVSGPWGADEAEAVPIVVHSSGDSARASLSWSATSAITDIPGGAASQNLFVRLDNLQHGFRGGQIDLTWLPASTGAGCFDHIGEFYKSSSGTTCTYLNRGTVIPVVTRDDPMRLSVSWSNTALLTSCTAGTALIVFFETDACASQPGCFRLDAMSILDDSGGIQVASVVGPYATVNGGSTYCAGDTPVDSLWRPQPAPKPDAVQVSVSDAVARGYAELRLAIPAGGPVCLAVYDALGRRIVELLDERLDAGTYTRRWDLRDATGARVPAGLYAVQLAAGSVRRTARLLVVP